MIFSIICEELGLFGAGMILFLFLVLIWRFYVTASRCTDLFGALLVFGAMAHMMIQVILNISVVTNTIPNTGITLPFVSYGGTSGGVPADRNGACIWRIISGKIRKTWYKGSIQMGKKKTKRKSHRLYAFVVLLLAAAILGAERAGSFLCTAD